MSCVHSATCLDDVHLVVARFDEDVSWLFDVVVALTTLISQDSSVHIFIYNKGPDLGSDVLRKLKSLKRVRLSVACLPNVGRESHSYLEHILRARGACVRSLNDRTIDVTVFMQGRMCDHVPCEHTSIAAFVCAMAIDAASSPLGESRNHACHSQFGSFNATPRLRVAMYPGVGDSQRDFGAWFTSFVGPWRWDCVSDGPSWWQHAVFAIVNTRLLSDSVDDAFFHTLKAEVDWHVNPEAGHFFERAWCHIFPDSQTEWPCSRHRVGDRGLIRGER